MNNNLDFLYIKSKISEIKNIIKKQINNEQIYDDFIKPLVLYTLNNNTLYFITTSAFTKQTIKNNYANLIKEIINKELHSNLEIEFLTNVEAAELEETNFNLKNGNVSIEKILNRSNINPRFNFDNFVVSAFNKGAYNAVQTVFNQKIWNPIFISGDVGLGKTHLLNAVGNEYAKQNPNAKVLYITSDDFVRKIYQALSSSNPHEIEKVKDEFQNYDLLLMDDVQFLANKEKINEIFFNIFNHNVSHGKLIILTSDKSPEQLQNFEKRVKSRFLSGLYIQITSPSIESAKEILKNKIKEIQTNYIFPEESINFISRRNQNDIRKLEGYLHQILFYALNNLAPGSVITTSVIQKATSNTQEQDILEKGYDFDPKLLIEQVCLAYGTDLNAIRSKSQKKSISTARQVAIYVLRKKFNMPYAEIGKYFSNRNHSTIIEAFNKMEKIVKEDEGIRNFIEKIYKNF